MSSTQVIEYTTYTDRRTGEQWRERRVLDVPFDQIRSREMALTRVPRGTDALVASPSNDDNLLALPASRRARYNPDALAVVAPRRSADLRRGGRRDISPSSSGSESDSSRNHRSRRRHDGRRGDGHRRARSEQPPPPAAAARGDDDGVLWYSMKKRSEGNWLERNFDPSYDGIIAAAAGAALGAMTARQFTSNDDERKKWKTLGGAVAGAVGFNAAENWYRVYTEEREERKEEAEEEQKEEAQQQQQPGRR